MPNNTLRVMLVGLGKAGKTSLLRAMTSSDRRTDRIAIEDRTVGIDISEHTTSSGLKVFFWDFAGATRFPCLPSVSVCFFV